MDKKFGKQFCRNLYILAKNTFLVILHGATNANKNRFGQTKFRTCLSKLHETERSTANSSRSQAIQQGLNERFPNINILKVQVSAFFKIGITDKEENDVFESRMKKVYFIKQTQTETWTFRKSRPWIFRKGGPNAKIHYNGQKFIFDKLKSSDCKYDSFLRIPVPKYPNKAIFIQNFFLFYKKLCILTNSKELISNMTKIFSNSGLKVPKQCFVWHFLAFFCLAFFVPNANVFCFT